ncbi:MAG TPA: flagellar motor switch protein FliN [Pirellulales bacterium]|jgi:flagellar motor switch protein FliN/FliY
MADNTGPLGQDDIDQLLKQAQGDAPPAAAAPPPQAAPKPAAPAAAAGGQSGALAQGDIDFLLNQAEQALASINAPADSPSPGVKPFRLPEFASTSATSDAATLDLIRDVELDLRIELGRTHMHLEEVLRLSKGSVVTLDKLAGDPVDIFVNGRLIARGEVLILNENFCVRVAELMVPENARASA